jgi:hypothetical protein
VLPDRDFVQMRRQPQIKFKLSVAGVLHLPAGKGPKLEQVNESRTPWPPRAGALPLTEANAAGFNPVKARGKIQWLGMRT